MTGRREYDPVCSVPECGKPHKSSGFCMNHYMRWKRTGSPFPAPSATPHGNRRYENRCQVEACERPHKTKGYCNMHWLRLVQRGDLGPVGKIERGRYKDSSGYIVVRKEGNRKIYEHRLVMEQQLGRELADRENVHHLNGVKDDNRPENLELWVKPQPQGQRVADLVAWVVGSYPQETQKALERFKNGTS
jgi:hypothetical protein